MAAKNTTSANQQEQQHQTNYNQGPYYRTQTMTETPAWVNDLKNEFKTPSNRLITLESIIANNSNRIDQLFKLVGEQICYE